MSKKINILYLVDGFRFGGAETKLLELIRHLDRKKHRVFICSLETSGSLKEEFEKLYCPLTIFHRKHRFDVSLICKLIRYMRKNKIDIAQTILYYADFLGAFTARLAGVGSVISWETISHNHEFYSAKHRGWTYRWAMKFVDTIVVVSNEVKNSLIIKRRIPEAKIKTINYGVNTRRYFKAKGQARKREFALNGDYPIIGVVARLAEVKGHRFLLDALPSIIKQYPKTRCLFIGDGESRQSLEKQCQKLEIFGHVRFFGFRDDVSSFLPVLDLFVLPSVSEGLPNVILEAQACSVPVVASRVGGIPEIIRHNYNGLLVPPENSEALSDEILSLLKNKKRMQTMGENGRSVVEKQFSLDGQITSFQNLYRTLSLKKVH